MPQFSRRDFLKSSVAASVLSGATGGLVLATPTKRTATDWVTLGKSECEGYPPGLWHRHHQRTRPNAALGQEGFTRLVRSPTTAASASLKPRKAIGGMPEMLAIALKGLPRDSYRLMTKYSTPGWRAIRRPKIDEFPEATELGLYRHSAAALPASAHLGHGLREPRRWVSRWRSKKASSRRTARPSGLQALRTIPGDQSLRESP